MLKSMIRLCTGLALKPYTRSAVNLHRDLGINPESSPSAPRKAVGYPHSHMRVIIARPNENGKKFGLVNLLMSRKRDI